MGDCFCGGSGGEDDSGGSVLAGVVVLPQAAAVNIISKAMTRINIFFFFIVGYSPFADNQFRLYHNRKSKTMLLKTPFRLSDSQGAFAGLHAPHPATSNKE
jgi:hypothetical protein